ncbi:CPBP family intramembrane glutamic endopeptidase [Pseudanabaena sp. FACHB-2040]|uniref:CPBP family intramembrane glutamic endopeptidase n=1 Tax=Pseudanabaena sp. FACHB-2040 TaxID=2692859 RepID=UPI001683E475|nr:CPBP family intramembrane glutamic endopeptidase [Pseudanabaena sp. FACHB-2040]MBD2259731.1 CPBP family intramembrane metalloprotease [Pseudanabaena sp. FACHB-2040]
MTETSPLQGQFLRPFWLLFGLGFLGILALPFILLPQLQQLIPQDQTEFSPGGLVILSLIQPTVLLAIATAVGLKLAPNLSFRSYLANAATQGLKALAPLRNELPVAVGGGVLFAAIAVLSDALILPRLGAAGQALAITANRSWGTTLSAVLYGGITEELLMRWGLMTLLLWLGWRLFRRRREVGSGLVWGAIVLTALLFGLAHLPFVLAQLPLTPWLLFRTLILNGLGGLVFGWLYWKHSLEAAMTAHVSTHLAFTAIALLL